MDPASAYAWAGGFCTPLPGVVGRGHSPASHTPTAGARHAPRVAPARRRRMKRRRYPACQSLHKSPETSHRIIVDRPGFERGSARTHSTGSACSDPARTSSFWAVQGPCM